MPARNSLNVIESITQRSGSKFYCCLINSCMLAGPRADCQRRASISAVVFGRQPQLGPYSRPQFQRLNENPNYWHDPGDILHYLLGLLLYRQVAALRDSSICLDMQDGRADSFAESLQPGLTLCHVTQPVGWGRTTTYN